MSVSSVLRWILRTGDYLRVTSRWRLAFFASLPLLAFAFALLILLELVFPSMALGEHGVANLPAGTAQRIRTELALPTPAERERMRQLEFIGKPFPVLPPMQVAFVPQEGRFGGAPYVERQAFRDFRSAFAASGCGSGRVDNAHQRDRAKEALRSMDRGLRGFSQARLRYHEGLLELCYAIDAAHSAAGSPVDRYAAALDHFQAADAALADLNGSERWVRQYREVTRLGRVLARRLLNEPEALWMPRMDRFPGPLCDGAGTDCDLFDRRASNFAGATLGALLAGPDRGGQLDRPAYSALKRQLIDIPLSSPELTANLAAAALLFEDPPQIGHLMENARIAINDGDDSGRHWRDTPALARLINIAWINGRLSADWRPPPAYFSPAPDRLPIEVGFERTGGGQANPDIELMRPWNQLLTDRENLASGRSAGFARFAAQLSGASEDPPESRLFLRGARTDLAARLGPVLLSEARRLANSPGGDAQSRALLKLLKTNVFPFRIRADALFYDTLGMTFYQVLLLLGVVYLIGILICWACLNVAVGHYRAFPHRHHDDRKRKSAAAASV